MAALLLAACGEAQNTAPTPASVSKPAPEQTASPVAITASDSKTAPTPTFKPTKEQERVAENYCYAVHAVGNCPDLIMRMDTPAKAEKITGAEINSPQSPYAEACTAGLIKAQKDKNLCSSAWKRFGCGGKEIANLIQQSGGNNPILCKFSG